MSAHAGPQPEIRGSDGDRLLPDKDRGDRCARRQVEQAVQSSIRLSRPLSRNNIRERAVGPILWAARAPSCRLIAVAIIKSESEYPSHVSTALVTGALGHAGGHLARRVADGGLTVRALVRTDEQARVARQQGWEAVRGDLTDLDTLSPALDGVDFVVHAAAYTGDSAPLSKSVNVDGTRELAERALEAGVRRFVQISTMSVYGDPIPPEVDEESALATTDPEPYCATKALAELELVMVRSRGLPVAILRPGMITHWVGSQWGNEMVERIRATGWPEFLHPDDVMPWVHTENLAEMVWLCLTHATAPDEAFIAADCNVNFRDFYGPVAMALDRPMRTPSRAPTVSSGRIGKIGATLGYRPRFSFEETVARLVELAKHPAGSR